MISPWVQSTSQSLTGGGTSLFMGNYSMQTGYHKKPFWQLLLLCLHFRISRHAVGDEEQSEDDSIILQPVNQGQAN